MKGQELAKEVNISLYPDLKCGEGTAEEAVVLLVANLLQDCGPAVNGTADDFKAA